MTEEFLWGINLKLSQITDAVEMLVEGASPSIPSTKYMGILNLILRDLDNTIFEIEQVSQKEYDKDEIKENKES